MQQATFSKVQAINLSPQNFCETGSRYVSRTNQGDRRTANWLERSNGLINRTLHPRFCPRHATLTFGGSPPRVSTLRCRNASRQPELLRVTFSPFLLMDVPPGNTLANPYSDDAATPGQPAFPWRGQITSLPAAGFAGSVDQTSTAAAQVAAFFGAATPASFSLSGDTVSWAAR